MEHNWIGPEDDLIADSVFYICSNCSLEKEVFYGLGTQYWYNSQRTEYNTCNYFLMKGVLE